MRHQSMVCILRQVIARVTERADRHNYSRTEMRQLLDDELVRFYSGPDHNQTCVADSLGMTREGWYKVRCRVAPKGNPT